MYKKIVLLLSLIAIIKSQGDLKIEQDAEFAGGELLSEGRIRQDGKSARVNRYKVAEKKQLTEKEILDELECFEDGNNVYFKKFDKARWTEQVTNIVNTRMEEGKRYEAYFVKNKANTKYRFQFIFWRIADTIYSVLGKRNPRGQLEGSNVASNPVFQETMKFYRPLTSETCFKMIPKGCKYSGQSSEYIQELCVGYDEIAEHLKTDILKVSAVVNTENGKREQIVNKEGDSKRAERTISSVSEDNKMNPAVLARDFAKCLSRRVRNNTIQLDCAVKGMPMDHSWAIERLNSIRDDLVRQGMTNVTVDSDNLSLNYDEDLGVYDEKAVVVSESDFVAK